MSRFYGAMTLNEALASPIGGLSKAGILAEGLTVREYNSHCKVSSAGRLVARYAGMIQADTGAEDTEALTACLTEALYTLADAEDTADAMTLTGEALTEAERAGVMRAERDSNSRPGDAGNHDCPATRFARALAKLDIPEALYALATEQRDGKALARLATLGADTDGPADLASMARTLHKRAHVALGLADGETLDKRGRVKRPKAPKVQPALPPVHSCGPKADGETWASWGARNKGCPACRDERDHIPEPCPVAVSPSWGGLQGDRLADRGRWAAVEGPGLGASRIATAL